MGFWDYKLDPPDDEYGCDDGDLLDIPEEDEEPDDDEPGDYDMDIFDKEPVYR